jgi:hypothetical protein
MDRQHQQGNIRLLHDYFAAVPTYSDATFRRQFDMCQALFLEVVAAVEKDDDYLVQKRDAAGKLGLFAIQTVTAVLRQLAYGTPAEAGYDYMRIRKSRAIKRLKNFCFLAANLFEEEYLWAPTEEDI